MGRCGRLVQALVERSGIDRRYSVREVQATAKLAAAGVAQCLFALVMMLLLDLGPAAVLGPVFRADLVVLGAVLGLGELALASFLCNVGVRLALLRSGDRGADRSAAWLVQGRGGWMSQFNATVRTAPAWFAVGSICLYVAVEELVFRGILIELLRGAGAVPAVGASLLLFVAAQLFNMPSARAAAFPAAGAVVVGLVHGVLYWRVPDVLPLVAAHLTFFVGALGMPLPEASRVGRAPAW
ncbi:MAG TPA: CPBP family glutamic-type intramembrane protease [Gemmatimonadaceae bacterium]|nr:CPBP family glutamic-type intramembrane protease [Gemmatimonadaceae bacterium]